MTIIGMTLLAFALISFAAFGVVTVKGIRSNGRDKARQRLRRVALQIHDPRSGTPEASIIREDEGGLRARLEKIVTRLPFSIARHIDVMLYRAGIGIGAWRFSALSLSLGAGMMALGIRVFHEWALVLPLGLVGLGWGITEKARPVVLISGGMLGACAFYFATNSVAWLNNPVYVKSWAGWVQSFTIGEPGYPPPIVFFRNTVFSGALFTATIVLAVKYFGVEREEERAGTKLEIKS